MGQYSPGRRWKFSVVTDGRSMLIFGGMALWEGYLSSTSLSTANNVLPVTDIVGGSRKPGGFLDDMWVFRKRLLTRGWGEIEGNTTRYSNSNDGDSDPENYASQWEENPIDPRDFGFWEKVNKTKECLMETESISWESRDDEYCRTFWPAPRAGHVTVLDLKTGGVWLHGGYRTHFPYLNTADVSLDRFSIRKNETTKSTPRDSNRGRVPYAAFDYFLDGKSFFLHGQLICFHSHVFVELYIASLRSLVL